MNTRNIRPIEMGQTKQYSMSIAHNGKVYAICDKKQFEYLMGLVAQEALSELATGEQLDPEVLRERMRELAAQKVEEKGYSTRERILARMTPEQRKEWEISYRFAPFVSKVR